MRNYENFGRVLSRYINAGEICEDYEDSCVERVRDDAKDRLHAMSKEILLPDLVDVDMAVGLSGLETLVFHAKYVFGDEYTNVTITVRPSLVDLISVSCSASRGFSQWFAPVALRESICVEVEDTFYDFMTRYA